MKPRMIFIAILAIILSAISWILNFGFVRLYCSILLLPILHAVVVLGGSVFLTPLSEQKRIRLYNYLFSGTYALCNLLLPDMSDSSQYMFFGLIEDNTICRIGTIALVIIFILHITLLILQSVEVIRIKKHYFFS